MLVKTIIVCARSWAVSRSTWGKQRGETWWAHGLKGAGAPHVSDEQPRAGRDCGLCGGYRVARPFVVELRLSIAEHRGTYLRQASAVLKVCLGRRRFPA